MPLVCGHDAPAYGLPVCAHIRTAPEPLDHYVHYTGRGTERQRICGQCRVDAGAGRAVVAGRLCEPCFDGADGSVTGAVGLPQTVDASGPVAGAGPLVAFPEAAGAVVDLAPTEQGLLLLSEDGRILLWDVEGGGCAERARSTVEVPVGATPWNGHEQVRRLHASSDGRFAAVVVDFGKRGEVFDLASGEVTMSLENDGYRSNTVPFSLLFTEHAGRSVVVHRTEWNRVGAFDPATGEPVALMPADDSSGFWSHCFQGGLHASPAGRRVASDAWWWHPSGQPVAWDLARWLEEGEAAWGNGLGAFRLPPCDYHWNRPMVWLDEDRLVLGGLGDDDLEIVPGARVFDVSRAEEDGAGGPGPAEVAVFGGPRGRFFAAEGLLFSSSEAGLEIWDPVAGARIGAVPGFRPTHHDRTRGELLERAATGIRRRPATAAPDAPVE
ncbi:hypothetical protein ACIPW5_05705 [Streptomyces sp. NPDC090077]|uniref:hypothetical protein n=1 Tax=Streptomyces sp. NPDC090077 TaxID=3365938 RepID=UPI0037FA75EF